MFADGHSNGSSHHANQLPTSLVDVAKAVKVYGSGVGAANLVRPRAKIYPNPPKRRPSPEKTMSTDVTHSVKNLTVLDEKKIIMSNILRIQSLLNKK
ncbi:hypothetical protein TIFTF001_006183 [Ficus carica]|uniref:Uncharacterized protein n=1 Tax=Ficus carica TaxID=3494 RepID=A0AA87ZQJ0_FICCA|nr:hypothetical protein TIFTF001_006183 [Ficus carica]